MDICPRCSGNNIDQGWVMSGGISNPDITYRSDNRKVFRTSEYIRAHVCLSCGHMEFSLDVNNLKKKIKNNKGNSLL
jgi:hypothetical protein